jgi:MFS family permease
MSTTESGTRVGIALDNVGLTRAHRIILLCVMAGGFFDVFEQNGAAVTGPSLQALWNLSTTQVGLLASATFGAMVVGGVATGILADRAGRKTLFAYNLAIYSLGGLLCAFAPNFEILIIGRLIVGLGLGGELTIALPFLSELMPTKFRGTAVSLFNMGAGGLGNPVAFLFGALIIGVVGPALGGMDNAWRWYFGLLALPALLVLYIRRNLPETPRFLVSKGRIPEANEALSQLASGRLSKKDLTVTQYLDESAGQDFATATPQTAGSGVRDVFRGRLLVNTVTIGLGAFMSFGGQLAALTIIPIILVSRGYSIGNSLAFTAVMQGGALLGTIAAAYLNHRLPRRMVVVPAAIMAGIFGVVFALLGTTIPTIIIFGFIFNFFVLLSNTTLWAWAPEVYPTRVRATGTGIIVNTGLAGQAVMPPVAAVLFSSFGIYVMFAVVAAMYVILAVLALFAPETFGRDLEELHGEV